MSVGITPNAGPQPYAASYSTVMEMTRVTSTSGQLMPTIVYVNETIVPLSSEVSLVTYDFPSLQLNGSTTAGLTVYKFTDQSRLSSIIALKGSAPIFRIGELTLTTYAEYAELDTPGQLVINMYLQACAPTASLSAFSLSFYAHLK